MVAEIKTTPTQLQPTSEAKVEPNTEVVAEPAAKAVEFEAELNSLFQMVLTRNLFPLFLPA